MKKNQHCCLSNTDSLTLLYLWAFPYSLFRLDKRLPSQHEHVIFFSQHHLLPVGNCVITGAGAANVAELLSGNVLSVEHRIHQHIKPGNQILLVHGEAQDAVSLHRIFTPENSADLVKRPARKLGAVLIHVNQRMSVDPHDLTESPIFFQPIGISGGIVFFVLVIQQNKLTAVSAKIKAVIFGRISIPSGDSVIIGIRTAHVVKLIGRKVPRSRKRSRLRRESSRRT